MYSERCPFMAVDPQQDLHNATLAELRYTGQ